MLIRALIVLLLALNLGVAGWWWLRAPPPAPAAVPLPPGVTRLQLVDEVPTPPAPASGVAVAATPERVAAEQCLSLGPFTDVAQVAQARANLQSMPLLRVRERQVPSGPVRGWRVFLPPFADMAEAEAVVARVAAAGFDDYFLVREGPDARSLALGRYASETTARARAAALAEAGFAAHAEPIRSGATESWLDLAAATGFDAARAQSLSGAAQRQPLDCAQLQ